MAIERDRARPQTGDGDNAEDRFGEALREAVEPVSEDETSCEDADAGAFLERFPAAARTPQRPKDA